MKVTCCPQYTIRFQCFICFNGDTCCRLDTQTFKPSRDQRQCLHKWSKYILGEDYIREAAKKFPKSKDEKKKQRNEFNLVESVHAPEYATVQHQAPLEPAHKLGIDLEPDNYTEEKYALFENYQRIVHKEEPSDISRAGFKRFLCASPLERTTTSEKKLGSFHQCYRIDGRLVAMAVLDLLPNCVSGVYFIYHEDYAKWSFGKLSACREAVLAKEGSYRYYYMGYYIQTCPKMLYKGEYNPSDLLDPETYEWNPLDEDLKNLMQKNKYVCPSEIRAGKQSGDDGVTKDTEAAKPQDGVGEVDACDKDEDEEVDLDPGYIFKTKMPGIMSEQQLKAFDIGNVNIKIDNTQAQAKDLVGFEKLLSLHTLFKETVATVGVEFAKEMVLVLR